VGGPLLHVLSDDPRFAGVDLHGKGISIRVQRPEAPDVKELFTRRGEVYLREVAVSAADRFAITALMEQLELFVRQLREADGRLRKFGKSGPLAEREARAILESIPMVGPVTIDAVLSELGDWRRFRSQKAVAAFAGLDPGMRSSADQRYDLHITKEGSRLLRWALIQAAWRLVIWLRSPPGLSWEDWRRSSRRLLRETNRLRAPLEG